MANEVVPQEEIKANVESTVVSATTNIPESVENTTVVSATTEPTATPATKEPIVEPSGDKKPDVVQQLLQTRKRAQAVEQENAYLKGQLEEARKGKEIVVPQTQTTTVPKTNGGEPDLANYSTYEEWLEAEVDYKLDQKLKSNKEKEDQEKQKVAMNERERKFQVRAAKAVEKYPDYDEIVSQSQVPLSSEIVCAIKESELGPDVAYYLAKNPDEVERISQMGSSISAIREIGKIEAKLSLVPPVHMKTKQVTQAPEPIKPVEGLVQPTKKEYGEMSMEEYVKQRNAEVRSRMQPLQRK